MPCHTSSTASTSSPKASASASLASRALTPMRSSPGGELEEGIAAAGIEMIEHARRAPAARPRGPRSQLLDRVEMRKVPSSISAGLVDPLGPEQGDRFGQVADEVPAEAEQDGSTRSSVIARMAAALTPAGRARR
jgi:hypothetical protein